MKAALGIIVVLVLALGVWLSLRLGATMPPADPGTPAAISTIPGWTMYRSSQFSIQYPARYTLGSTTEGAPKFTIDPDIATGTNLSQDSYVSVEPRPNAINSCSAEIYLSDAHSAGQVDEGGRRYSVATSTGAAAGNRYEEVVFATPVAEGCIAVRYFIHYGVFENYPAGTVEEFDRAKLMRQFDQIRKTLTLAQ